jgi:hypothetical protein
MNPRRVPVPVKDESYVSPAIIMAPASTCTICYTLVDPEKPPIVIGYLIGGNTACPKSKYWLNRIMKKIVIVEITHLFYLSKSF